ncbi:hypothetical protein CO611_01015 [Lysobacteraceae bacterium NML03-0222]|nr:hypothetical protein CO611_01015 [Xanthomonadaceae bacterium NML03-0222]
MSATELNPLLEEARDAQAALAGLLAEGSPLPHIVALFDDIHLAFIAADKAAIKRRVGWLGRLLGRDIDTGLRARELRQQAPLLKHRLDTLEAQWQHYGDALARHEDRLSSLLTRLQAADQNLAGSPTHAQAEQRLAQMRLLLEMSSQQLALIHDQHAILGEAFPTLRQGLLSVLAQTDAVNASVQQQQAYRHACNTLRALAVLKPQLHPKDAETS